MKLHQYFEFGPASQDPFSFCQIQLGLDTVYVYLPVKISGPSCAAFAQNSFDPC
jgi:hypothetical protein